MVLTAQAAQAAQVAQVDRAVMALEAVLGMITPLAEGEAEAEEVGPLLAEALHQAEDLEEAVMETVTGMKEQRGGGPTLPWWKSFARSRVRRKFSSRMISEERSRSERAALILREAFRRFMLLALTPSSRKLRLLKRK